MIGEGRGGKKRRLKEMNEHRNIRSWTGRKEDKGELK